MVNRFDIGILLGIFAGQSLILNFVILCGLVDYWNNLRREAVAEVEVLALRRFIFFADSGDDLLVLNLHRLLINKPILKNRVENKDYVGYVILTVFGAAFFVFQHMLTIPDVVEENKLFVQLDAVVMTQIKEVLGVLIVLAIWGTWLNLKLVNPIWFYDILVELVIERLDLVHKWQTRIIVRVPTQIHVQNPPSAII